MAWVPLTQKSIEARLSAGEMDTYLNGTERAAQMDVVAEIISQVTAMVRAKVAACSANLSGMGPPGTIPEETIHAAVTIARSNLIGSFPVGEAATAQRTAELTEANKFLDSIASCSVSIAGSDGSYPKSGDTLEFGGAPLLDFQL